MAETSSLSVTPVRMQKRMWIGLAVVAFMIAVFGWTDASETSMFDGG